MKVWFINLPFDIQTKYANIFISRHLILSIYPSMLEPRIDRTVCGIIFRFILCKFYFCKQAGIYVNRVCS